MAVHPMAVVEDAPKRVRPMEVVENAPKAKVAPVEVVSEPPAENLQGFLEQPPAVARISSPVQVDATPSLESQTTVQPVSTPGGPATYDEMEQAAMTPIVNVPRFGEPGTAKRGFSELLSLPVEVLTSPGTPLIAAAQLIPGLREVVDTTFAASLTKSAAQRLGEASATGNKEQFVRGVGELVLGGLAARGAAKQPPTLLKQTQAELSTLPGERTTDAIPQREAAPLPLEEPPGNRPQMGAQVREQAQAQEAEEAITLPTKPAAESEVPRSAAPIEEPKAAGQVEPAATPEITGMGGATPKEFEPASQTVTSIKNAKVEEERAARGLPPAIQPARRSFGDVWDRAMAKVDQDPGAQDRLVLELAERPRALTDLEDALLLHRQIDLQNDYGKATRELAQAWDDGRVEDAQVWKDRVGQLSDQLKVLYDVDKAAGTETGRGLAARRMLANERFELAQMEMDLRAAKGGEKLSETDYKALIPLQEEIANLQKKLDAKEKELEGKVTRKMPRKGATEAEKLEAWKTRSQKTAAELEKQIQAGKAIQKPKREPIKLDQEGLHIAFRLKKLKEKWMEMIVREQLKREELTKRIVRRAFESSGLVRGLLSSEDLSAVLRQGKFAAMAHPILASKSIGPMLKAFASEEAAFKVEHDIMTRPNTQRYIQSGLALTDMHNPSLARMEEMFMGKWLEKIPGVAGSARAYVTFLNKLRADVFDSLTATLGDGTPSTDRVIANTINVFTGRGKLPFNEQTAVGLNAILYAPRFVASRFQAVLGQPLYHGLLDKRVGFEGTAKARALVAGEYAKILAGYAVIYGLAQAAGFKVGTDPKSTDFGKIIMGRTRLDPLAGVSQVTVLMSRLRTGKITTQKGKEVPIRGKVPYGGRTTADVIGSFLRQKLAPAPQLFMDVTTQKFVTGEEVTKGALAQHYLVPISYQDIFDTMRDQGVPAGTALTILSIFGENVQTFDEMKKR